MNLPPTVESCIALWERLDRARARWEQAFGEPWPSLEDQLAELDRWREVGETGA